MSAVLRPERDSQAFFDSQQLPPEKRGVTFEALFFRQLQLVTTKIHETENVDQIMLEVSQDICKLFNADRLTLYAVNEDRTAIVSKVKTGLNVAKDLKLPISAQSIAGYVAFSKQMVNIADVYDDEALKRIHPTLSFLKEVDKRSGYRTKQMLVLPILDGDVLHGVIQVINNKSDQPFGDLEIEGSAQLCKTLATAIRQRMQKELESQRRRATKYDGLLADGVLTQEELQKCIAQGPGGRPAGRARADVRLPDPPGADRPLAGPVLRRAVRAVQRRAHPVRAAAGTAQARVRRASRAGFRWRNLPRGWSSCAWTRRPCAARASCRRCSRAIPGSRIASPRRPSSRKRWRSSMAPAPASPSTSCWRT